MALRDFFVDRTNPPETSLERGIRAQLRLSSNWRVVGMRVVSDQEAYDENCPDIREAVESRNLEPSCSGTVYYWITQDLKDAYRCPCCGKLAKPMSYHTRSLHHVTDKGFHCMLLVNIPKLDCKGCGHKPRMRFPAADDRKGYTRQLAKAVMASLKKKSKSDVASEFDLDWSTVDWILNDVVRKAIPEQDLSHVTGVFVDETQFGSGQNYISVFLDQKHDVIFVCQGHGKDVLKLFESHLIVQGGDPNSVMFFSADMSRSYEAGIMETFPNATLVWDRFHLAKSINDALNDIRKKMVKRDAAEALRLIKYTILSREGNLSETQAKRLRRIRLSNPEMALAFDMKEVFLDIIKLPDPKSMQRSILAWIEWVELEGHEILKKKASKFREKLDRIVSWTRYSVSNSVCEGVNKNIQDIRRQACGYKDVDSFFNMILLRQGELTFRF